MHRKTNLFSTVDAFTLTGTCGSKSQTPWIPAGKKYAPGLTGFNEEVEHFLKWIKPTPLEMKLRELVFLQVKAVIRRVLPNAKVDFHGSLSTDLCLPTSDIDVVVRGRWAENPMYRLAQEFLNSNLVYENSLDILDKTTVPIIKMAHRETLLMVDICFNVPNCLCRAEYIQRFVRVYPRLRDVVLLLKQFLFDRYLNDVFLGGLGSYALTLMCIYFFQTRSSYRSVGQLCSGRMRYALRAHLNVDSRNGNLKAGMLFLEFLEIFGRLFNYCEVCIRLTEPDARDNGKLGLFVRPSFFQDGCYLHIQDPLNRDNNIGRGAFKFFGIRCAFEYAYLVLCHILEHPDDAPLVGDGISTLVRVLAVSHETIAYRQWLHNTFFSRVQSLSSRNGGQPVLVVNNEPVGCAAPMSIFDQANWLDQANGSWTSASGSSEVGLLPTLVAQAPLQIVADPLVACVSLRPAPPEAFSVDQSLRAGRNGWSSRRHVDFPVNHSVRGNAHRGRPGYRTFSRRPGVSTRQIPPL